MGEVWEAAPAALSGESATSESEDVPGLTLAFFEGDGLSIGPGVPSARLTLFVFPSSVYQPSVLKNTLAPYETLGRTFSLDFHVVRSILPIFPLLRLSRFLGDHIFFA